MSDYPFPFIGSGDANYFEWAEVHVEFERAPTETEQAAIAGRVPPPLRDSIDFEDTHLMVASDQFAHVAMMEAYDKDPGDESEDEGGRFPFAATSKVQAFNEDTADWLRHADRQCPIRVAYRAEDWEAGGTELDAWHEWSVGQLPEVLEQFDADALDRYQQYMVRGLIEYAAPTIDDIPSHLRDVVLPGQREVEAIEEGDVGDLRAALQERTCRWDDAVPRIAEQVDEDDAEQLRTLAAAADLLCERELGHPMVTLLARAALDTGSHDLLADVAKQCRQNSLAASYLGILAYELMQDDRFEDALRLYDVLVELSAIDLSTYNNSLYAVMDDNSGLGVQPDRANKYLEASLPHAPENPAIFYNAACVFMELGELERVYKHIRLALEHGYDKPEQIRDDEVFEPIRDEERFQKLFDDT